MSRESLKKKNNYYKTSIWIKSEYFMMSLFKLIDKNFEKLIAINIVKVEPVNIDESI